MLSRVLEVQQLRADMGRLQALEMRKLAGIAAQVLATTPAGGRARELAFRSTAAELAVACRVSDRTMTARLEQAQTIVRDFPATLDALEAGTIESGHLRVISGHGRCIDDADARSRYETTVLERAVRVTPGRLGKFAELTAARLAEVTFDQRHQEARARRCVMLRKAEDGMSELSLYLPTLLAVAVSDRLTQQAKTISHNGNNKNNHSGDRDDRGDRGADSCNCEPRSFDQLRADLACELLLTGQPSGDADAPHKAGIGIRAEVAVVIPILSLLGQPAAPGAHLDPAILTGHSPIGMDDALRLAGHASGLVRVLTHPISGMVITADTYRPTESLRRYLRLRDGRCRHPSCNRNPNQCDIDHTLDWDYGGKTRPDNLAYACRGHHTLKHNTDWKVKQVAPGILEWTSPLGQVITDLPDNDLPGNTIGINNNTHDGDQHQPPPF